MGCIVLVAREGRGLHLLGLGVSSSPGRSSAEVLADDRAVLVAVSAGARAGRRRHSSRLWRLSESLGASGEYLVEGLTTLGLAVRSSNRLLS